MRQLKTMKNLYLGNTRLDDAAIDPLRRMEQLDLLFILDTDITVEGIARLLPALLSSCEIVHQSGTYRGQRNPDLAMARSSSPLWRSAR